MIAVAIAATACRSSTEELEVEATTSTTISTTATTLAPPTRPAYLDPDAAISDRVTDLLGRMTLAEKVGQMTELATAYLKGLQGTDLDESSAVLATPKHYVRMAPSRRGLHLDMIPRRLQ